jgi:hypothetical protein
MEEQEQLQDLFGQPEDVFLFNETMDHTNLSPQVRRKRKLSLTETTGHEQKLRPPKCRHKHPFNKYLCFEKKRDNSHRVQYQTTHGQESSSCLDLGIIHLSSKIHSEQFAMPAPGTSANSKTKLQRLFSFMNLACGVVFETDIWSELVNLFQEESVLFELLNDINRNSPGTCSKVMSRFHKSDFESDSAWTKHCACTKEKLFITEQQWNELRFRLHLRPLLPNADMIREELMKANQIAAERYGVKKREVKLQNESISLIYLNQVHQLIKDLITIDLNENKRRKDEGLAYREDYLNCIENSTTPTSIIVQYGLDQRGLKGASTFGVSLKNTQTFQSQSPHSIIPLGIWQGSEKCIQYVAKDLEQNIRENQRLSICWRGRTNEFLIKKLISTDLHANWILRNMNPNEKNEKCPLCHVTDPSNEPSSSRRFRVRDSWEFMLPFSPQEFVVCSLHFEERTTEDMFRLSLTKADETNLALLKDRLASLQKMSNVEVDGVEDSIELYFSKEQAQIIQNSAQYLFSDIVSSDIMNMWTKYKRNLNSIKYGAEEPENVRMEMKELFQKFKCFSPKKSWYFHYAAEHIDLALKKYGRLVDYNNEGFEHLHLISNYIEQHHSQKGVSKQHIWYHSLFPPDSSVNVNPLDSSTESCFPNHSHIQGVKDVHIRFDPPQNEYTNEGVPQSQTVVIRKAQIFFYFLRLVVISKDLNIEWNRMETRRGKNISQRINQVLPRIHEFDMTSVNDYVSEEEAMDNVDVDEASVEKILE